MNTFSNKIFRLVLENTDTILFTLFSFVLIRFFLLSPDFDQHTLFTLNYNCPIAIEFNQPHFLLFRTISLLTLQTCDYNTVLLVLQTVISFFIGFKYLIIKYKIKSAISNDSQYVINEKTYLAITFFTLFLSIFITIPNYLFFKKHWLYIYVLNGNSWHNSTFLVTLPFSILLFYKSFELINNPTTKNISIGIFLVFVNVFSKPVYLLSFIPVYFIFAYYFNRISKKFFLALIPVLVGIVFLAIQLFILSSDIYDDESGIKFDFFAVFALNYPSIWIFVFSLPFVFAFPIIFFLFNRENLFDKETVFALSTTFLSLMIATLFVEGGDRLSASNFLWGVATSINILFTVTVICLVKMYRDKQFNYKFYLPLIVLSLHFMTGAAYILKIMVYGWYM